MSSQLLFTFPPIFSPPRHRSLPNRIVMRSTNPARTAAITGASGGIGAQTAKGLVRILPNLEELFLCCRNVSKAEVIAQQLRNGEVAGRKVKVSVVPVELEDVGSIKECVKGIAGGLEGRGLDMVVCNAGIMAAPLGFVEVEGFGEVERQFFVNHLSHAILLGGLMQALKKAEGRVVFVSSNAVGFVRGRSNGPVVEEKIEGIVTTENYDKWKAYGDSKLAMSLYAKGLATVEGLETVSLHPGVVQTELGRYIAPWAASEGGKGWFGKILSLGGFKTPEQGAELSVELCGLGKGEFENGGMYTGVGGKKQRDLFIPLLREKEEWMRVYEDTVGFVESLE